jgi:DUF438 domain-containing protein
MSEAQNGSAEYRQEQLKGIVRDLHGGSDIKGVRRRFAELIRNVSPEEIAQMEQSLIAEGVPVEQVQQVCDVHVQVFEQSLGRRKRSRVLPGHPVHTYLEENKVLRRILGRMRPLLKQAPRGRRMEETEREIEELKKVELHYRRKENQLFPFLERAGFAGPSKVMWGKHDEIRRKLREVESAYRRKDWKHFQVEGRALLRALRRMIFMEERILFPTSLKKLSDRHWVEIRRGEGEIGYAWIEPGNLWDPSVVLASSLARDLGKARAPGEDGSGGAPTAGAAAGGEAPGSAASGSEQILLDVGELAPEQVNLMLKNLPVDITFVDENDRVRYYSQGRERIFPRSPAVIGRAVQNCHPPSSVHVVEKILDSFKRKEKDAAEFWLPLNDRFIHIRYFPLFDREGDYRGVMEVSQDVTEIRALKGQKRLLDW